MNRKKETLQKRLESLQERLRREQEKNSRVWDNTPWGAGMRRTKIGPSFAKEDELKKKIEDVKTLINKLTH